MELFKRLKFGLSFQFLLLVVNTQAFIEFSDLYLNDIRADEEAEQANGEYNYDNQGDDWTGTCATGQSQSPIDLIYNDAIITAIPRIRFHYYDQNLQTPLILMNNGHTANMVLPRTRGGRRAYITGGLLPGAFQVQSVHFHWGSSGIKGSEHAINFERYDVEMHIVHKNVRYETLEEASQFPDGLAVLGVMFNSDSKHTKCCRLETEHYGLNKIFNQLPQITKYQSNATITGRLTVGQLLGNIITGEFYSYNGSLTTPNCAEAVTWTVFKDTVDLPSRQIMKFWNLQDPRGLPLINNYRNLQKINDRKVYYRALTF